MTKHSFQTGSGKTFTITGGAERYDHRGIIPRTLSYIFAQYEMVSSYVHIEDIKQELKFNGQVRNQLVR